MEVTLKTPYRGPVRRYADAAALQGYDPILTNLALAYTNPAFVAESLFPSVPIAKESFQYFTIDPNKDRFRVYDDIRALRAKAAIVEWATTKTTAVAEEHAIAAAVDDREKAQAVDPIQPEQEAVESATDALALGRESEAAVLATTSGNYPGGSTTALAGGARWDTATGDPVGDIETGKEVIRSLIGRRPNTIILPSKVYAKVRLNTTVTDRIKYTTPGGILNPQLLAQLWDLDAVVNADAVQNTANLGQAAVTSDVWGKNAVLAFVNQRPAVRQLSFGYTFTVGGDRARRWREESEHSDYYETSNIRLTAIVANIAGYLIQTAIS